MAKILLNGFGIAGYRSFGSESLQRMGPLSGVHLLAGPNNSGKSNALQMARTGLPALRDGRKLELTEIDNPVGSSSDGGKLRLSVLTDISETRLTDVLGDRSKKEVELVHSILGGPSFRSEAHDDLCWFDFERSGQDWSIASEQVADVESSNITDPQLRHLSSILTSHRGSRTDNIIRIISSLAKQFKVRQSIPAEIVTIPAFREIRPTGDRDVIEGEYSGPGLIEELATLQNPQVGHRPDRRRFDGINEFVRTLFEDSAAEIEIPHDRKTILVHYEGRTLPLEHYGTGLHEVIILAAAAAVLPGALVCIEEPEIHLHPTLQRKLLRYLAENTDNQYLIATHSAHFLDAERASITSAQLKDGNSQLSFVVSPSDVSKLSLHLGARASDLVQSNAVIWVEGPSDRVYLRAWIQAVDSRLLEGIHYSIMFYGGRLLKHLAADDRAVGEFVSLPRINRNFAVVIDSDREKPGARINETKQRVRREVSEIAGTDSIWVTKGRTIENYVPPTVLAHCVESAHPGAKLRWAGDPYTDPLGARQIRNRRSDVDKMAIAAAVIREWPTGEWPLDLKQQVRRLIRMIRKANDLD